MSWFRPKSRCKTCPVVKILSSEIDDLYTVVRRLTKITQGSDSCSAPNTNSEKNSGFSHTSGERRGICP